MKKSSLIIIYSREKYNFWLTCVNQLFIDWNQKEKKIIGLYSNKNKLKRISNIEQWKKIFFLERRFVANCVEKGKQMIRIE